MLQMFIHYIFNNSFTMEMDLTIIVKRIPHPTIFEQKFLKNLTWIDLMTYFRFIVLPCDLLHIFPVLPRAAAIQQGEQCV